MMDMYEVVARYPNGQIYFRDEYDSIKQAASAYEEILDRLGENHVVTLIKYSKGQLPVTVSQEIKKGEDYEIDK